MGYKKAEILFQATEWLDSDITINESSEDSDNEYAMIDSTIIRAHQHSAGAQKKTEKTRR